MTDAEHAAAIHEATDRFHMAVLAARDDGLEVKIETVSKFHFGRGRTQRVMCTIMRPVLIQIDPEDTE